MPKKIILAITCCLAVIVNYAQTYTQWPLNNVKLTGNYGELRPNHFHAGLDFSSEEGENQPIYAIKSGYVSRIKISPYGYGKVLYISHFDGKLSVYAHQSRFNDSLENYVKREQLRQLNYEIELFPSKNELPIKEGELIGFMGNTGGSTGPHLHFEIRDEITEIPLNPLLVYKLTDTIKPICNAIAMFDMSDTLSSSLMKIIKVNSKNDSLQCQNDSVVLNKSVVAFGYSGFDCELNKGNPNNIYSTKIYVDSILIYHHQLNYLPFDFANYINEFSIEINKQKFQKCFVPEVYPNYLYKSLQNKGRVVFKDTLYHCIRFEFTDEYGTNNDLKLYLKTKQPITYQKNPVGSSKYLNCRQTFLYSTKSFTLELPPKSVYNYGLVNITDNYEKHNTIHVSMPNTNIRLLGNIRCKLSKSQLNNKSKLVVRNNNSIIIPKVSDDLASFNFKSFGKLEMLIDSVAPKIKTALSVKKIKKIIHNADAISFLVTDNLSGVKAYNLFINNNWVIAEYDAKYDLITYKFDKDTPLGELNFLLTVQDRVGNISVFKLQLNR